jgi:transcriptional regulator with XRE-family HTH domain
VRLKALRESAGLSQKQVAKQLGILQGPYALGERRDVALRADQTAKLAEILGTSADELVIGAARRHARGGPTGKARRVFEEVSRLPRNRQQRIIATVEDMLTAQRVAASS